MCEIGRKFNIIVCLWKLNEIAGTLTLWLCQRARARLIYLDVDKKWEEIAGQELYC